MLSNELEQLVRHMEWADALVWTSVLQQGRAHSDTHIKKFLHHVHQVQWAYLQIWRGQPLAMLDLSSFQDLQAIHRWCQEYYGRLPEFLDHLDSEALDEQIAFSWADELVKQWGKAQPATLADTILQVTSHTTYHRGQVNRRLRELGGDPPLTDFVVWIWRGKPTPEWNTVNAST